jgi:CRISPR-associated protein Cmr6
MATNPFAKAFLSQSDKLKDMGLEVQPPDEPDRWQTDAKHVPRMYRAQVMGRCSLHNAKKENQDLDTWTTEWIYPRANGEAQYQRPQPQMGQEGNSYRVEIAFPFRLFSNSGQDSIARPTIGKDGIPFLPGSSVKGLFLRACTPEQAAKYCGRDVRPQGSLQQLPGTSMLRFHGAYPVGNWANRLVDVVHPQGNRQLGTNGQPKEEPASASALISFYQPHLVFEFSCADPAINWREIELILLNAIQLGVGGKTSSGYGMGGNVPGKPSISPATRLSFLLKGDGVSSVLRDGTPEFRVNTFKANLRGHLRRLLGGVAAPRVNEVVDRWFGNTQAPAAVQLIWQPRQEPTFDDLNQSNRNPTYSVDGLLYADIVPSLGAPPAQAQADLALLEKLVQFAYVMGGFGKSWRRVWHKTFLPSYHTTNFAIGCHWFSPDFDQIQTPDQLQDFLTQLHHQCCNYLGVKEPQAIAANWREAWHPQRVAVFCQVGITSSAVHLFHNDTFKTTLAIGGRSPSDDRPKFVSSVWHRMLPLKNGTEYLEIVTVFHGDRTPWNRDEQDQLQPFVEQLKENGLKFKWGTEPRPAHSTRRTNSPSRSTNPSQPIRRSS